MAEGFYHTSIAQAVGAGQTGRAIFMRFIFAAAIKP
jgi:hypothetical protein